MIRPGLYIYRHPDGTLGDMAITVLTVISQHAYDPEVYYGRVICHYLSGCVVDWFAIDTCRWECVT